jgi:hypothetical protein
MKRIVNRGCADCRQAAADQIISFSPDHAQLLPEPPHPDGPLAEFGPVPKQIEPRVGVASQRDRACKRDDDALVRQSIQRGLERFEAGAGFGARALAEASIVAQEAGEHDINILPPGVCAARRRGELRQRLQPKASLVRPDTDGSLKSGG